MAFSKLIKEWNICRLFGELLRWSYHKFLRISELLQRLPITHALYLGRSLGMIGLLDSDASNYFNHHPNCESDAEKKARYEN